MQLLKKSKQLSFLESISEVKKKKLLGRNIAASQLDL